MEDEDSMDGLEAAKTENTVETGKGICLYMYILYMYSGSAFSLVNVAVVTCASE